jgi:serine/threonine protein phosphatase PrpC/Mg-chelatase subunit ChlD
LLICALASLLLIALPSVAQAQTEPVSIVRSAVGDDDATVITAVRLPAERVGTVLDSGDFSVFMNGQPQAKTAALVPVDQLEVVLVLDTAEELGAGTLSAMRGAVVEFLLTLPYGAKVSIVTAGAQPEVVVPFTSAVDEAVAGVSRITANPGTAMYDAVAVAAQLPGVSSNSRRVVIALSGGSDTSSQQPLEVAADDLAATEAIFYGISLPTPPSAGTAAGALANVAGGESFVATTADQLVGLYDRVARDLTSLYELSVASGPPDPTEVTVVVDTPFIRATDTARIFGTQPAPPAADNNREDNPVDDGRREVPGSEVVPAVLSAAVAALGVALLFTAAVRRRRVAAAARAPEATEITVLDPPAPAPAQLSPANTASRPRLATTTEVLRPADQRHGARTGTQVLTLRGSDCVTLGKVVAEEARAGGGGLAMSRGRLPKPTPSLDFNEDGALVAVGSHGSFAVVVDGHFGFDAAAAALDVTAEWAHVLVDDPVKNPELALEALLAEAQDRIATQLASVEARRQDSRTAITLALMTAGRCHVATIGDTSALLLRGRQRLIRFPEDRRYLGPDPMPALQTVQKVRPGDRLVVASDGLRDFSSTEHIVNVVQANRSQPCVQTAKALVEAALLGGAGDNVTVACLDAVTDD